MYFICGSPSLVFRIHSFFRTLLLYLNMDSSHCSTTHYAIILRESYSLLLVMAFWVFYGAHYFLRLVLGQLYLPASWLTGRQ